METPHGRESALTCRLLRQFLEADIQPEAALTTLNSAMALRGAETGSFTTVDLCVLRGGEAAFYKFGAAPSYLKKGGSRPPHQRQQPACRASGQPRRPGPHHRDAGAGELCRDGQRRCGRPQPG